MTLLLAKITGVHISTIRASAKVFMISSGPIPFRSPQVIPMTGFCLLLIICQMAVKIKINARRKTDYPATAMAIAHQPAVRTTASRLFFYQRQQLLKYSHQQNSQYAAGNAINKFPQHRRPVAQVMVQGLNIMGKDAS